MFVIPPDASRGLGWRTWEEDGVIYHAKLVEWGDDMGWEITVRRKDEEGRWWESTFVVSVDDVVDVIGSDG